MPAPPLHLLFLTHYFPPEGNAPATRVFELCRRWILEGVSVTVITGAPNVPSGKVYQGYKNKLWCTEEIAGIHVVRVWTYLAANRGTLRRIVNFLSYMVAAVCASCLVRRPDVVVATSPQFFCGWAGAFASKIRKVPFILEIRDLWPESIEAVGAMKVGVLTRFLTWLERKLYQQADEIVTVGEGYWQKLRERNVPAAKLAVIANGVDREFYAVNHAEDEVRKEYGLENKFVCSYVGTVGMAHGLGIIVRASAKLKERNRDSIVFMVVGDGARKSELMSEVSQRKLDNVLILGLQPKHRIPHLLYASDACLVHLKKHPLFLSVLPSKLFEALAMARPVILGVEGYAAEFLRNAGGGICIEPENEDELICAVEKLACNGSLAAALGQTGREFVMKHYDRDSLASNYLRLIRWVRSKHPGQSPPGQLLAKDPVD